MDIDNEVKNVVATELRMPMELVGNTLGVGDVPQWGSMAQMAIIVALQNKFGVKIPMEDLFDLTSVGDLVAEIEKLQHA